MKREIITLLTERAKAEAAFYALLTALIQEERQETKNKTKTEYKPVQEQEQEEEPDPEEIQLLQRLKAAVK